MIRIGIDTGGTFTDVVALDELSGAMVSTKTPSTPDDPSRAFLAGADKAAALAGADPGAFVHGTTVATNALLEATSRTGLALLTTEGYEHVLEIARQSVPDGYGNSYFWVKPDRIVPADRVREVGERLDADGAVVRPFDEGAVAEAAARFLQSGRHHDDRRLLPAQLRQPRPRARHARSSRPQPPGVAVSISSDVLREYREYERSVTTLVDAAVKPNAAPTSPPSRLDTHHAASPAARRRPSVMKSNGGISSAEEVVHQPITTVLSGPAAGAWGAAVVAKAAGFDAVLTSTAAVRPPTSASSSTAGRR